MSAKIKSNIMGDRGDPYREDNGRQSHDYQADRIAPITASNLHNGAFSSRKELRLYRKIYQ
tara:strand:+ start:611 stop:793 length:183 start_codon:yes stop_codon:yes gene_type:complete